MASGSACRPQCQVPPAHRGRCAEITRRGLKAGVTHRCTPPPPRCDDLVPTVRAPAPLPPPRWGLRLKWRYGAMHRSRTSQQMVVPRCHVSCSKNKRSMCRLWLHLCSETAIYCVCISVTQPGNTVLFIVNGKCFCLFIFDEKVRSREGNMVTMGRLTSSKRCMSFVRRLSGTF